MSSSEYVKCQACGSKYVRTAVWISSQEKGEERCSVCGSLLEVWIGRWLPLYRLAERARQRAVFVPPNADQQAERGASTVFRE